MTRRGVFFGLVLWVFAGGGSVCACVAHGGRRRRLRSWACTAVPVASITNVSNAFMMSVAPDGSVAIVALLLEVGIQNKIRKFRSQVFDFPHHASRRLLGLCGILLPGHWRHRARQPGECRSAQLIGARNPVAVRPRRSRLSRQPPHCRTSARIEQQLTPVLFFRRP